MRLMDFRPSELALLAWSRPISSSLISPSRAFLTRRASPLAFCSASREADIDSMARAWFFLVLLNSSSFSATRLSISCLTCPAQAGHGGPCFPPARGCPRPPQELPGAPPSPAQGDASVCPGHGWSGHPHQADPEDP